MTPITQNHFRVNAVELSENDLTDHLAKSYSRMKFGSQQDAAMYGVVLGARLMKQLPPDMLERPIVIMPSPYNYVKNAASLMARATADYMNVEQAQNDRPAVEWALVHRTITYTEDYGTLPADKRAMLLANDVFTINKAVIGDKVLIMVDDIRVTGAHEDKLIAALRADQINNDVIFAYGAAAITDDPTFESRLNLCGINRLKDVIDILSANEPIVRTIKHILSQDPMVLADALPNIPRPQMHQLFVGACAEGYHKVPKYAATMSIIRNGLRLIHGI